MFTLITTASPTSGSIRAGVRRHPLLAYFVLAFVGTWVCFSPITLSQRGLGILPVELSDAVVFILYFLATYTGPFLAAFLVTRIVDGGAGVRALLRRLVQWRIGVQWYLILLLSLI